MEFSSTDNQETINRQEIARELVSQEIYNNASQLIRHFSETHSALEGSEYSYECDLLPILEKPDWSSIETHSDSVEIEHITALEHWIVSPSLGARLFDMGEMVGELFGLQIWGRQTSGQAIYMDSVIQEIANSRHEIQNKTPQTNVDEELPF